MLSMTVTSFTVTVTSEAVRRLSLKEVGNSINDGPFLWKEEEIFCHCEKIKYGLKVMEGVMQLCSR